MYKCLYNLELLILATAKTPWQDYDQPIQKDSPANFVRRLEGTDVDALMRKELSSEAVVVSS
ncbi:MAG: hypothetical protein J6R33_05165, partial [Clostridia bacterium]|nr:hypothetical protein [Clostridia bacterium]